MLKSKSISIKNLYPAPLVFGFILISFSRTFPKFGESVWFYLCGACIAAFAYYLVRHQFATNTANGISNKKIKRAIYINTGLILLVVGYALFPYLNV